MTDRSKHHDDTSFEDKFRSSLEDVSEVANKLLPLCHTLADFVGMVELALANDGQLRLLAQLFQEQGASAKERK